MISRVPGIGEAPGSVIRIEKRRISLGKIVYYVAIESDYLHVLLQIRLNFLEFCYIPQFM